MSDTDDYQAPLGVRFVIPTETRVGFGVNSTAKEVGGGILFYRVTAQERELVEEAAKIIGLKVGTFSRNCITEAARQIVEHRNAYLKSRGGG